MLEAVTISAQIWWFKIRRNAPDRGFIKMILVCYAESEVRILSVCVLPANVAYNLSSKSIVGLEVYVIQDFLYPIRLIR